eukprot:TRINITY_DN15922_c0_g1_i1.p1 TRINITY_DN15922_c0_g1~~TRINITY_DN15922_c0_g1_i1.p1  ORF type:complete len:389 (+),score=31.51 TRINITY_DN15922_c0_g1_i1:290-1456(+)
MRGSKNRKGGGFTRGRPSITYIYFLLTMTVASVLIARDWFHPRLELLHQREFVQEEMGFFYHKSTTESASSRKSTAGKAASEESMAGLRAKASGADVMEMNSVKFLDLGKAAYVRGRNFEEDGYTLTCPEGQGALFHSRPLSVVIAFSHAGYEWVSRAFKHVIDQIDKDSGKGAALSSSNVVLLKGGDAASLKRVTQGREFRAVVVSRDPRDWVTLKVLSRPKSERSWSDGLLGKLFGRAAAIDTSEHEALDVEIDQLKQDVKRNLESVQGGSSFLSSTFDLVRFATEGNASSRVAFVRYEDMWQRNPKGGWPAVACWLGLRKQSVGQLFENQQRLEQEGFFEAGVGGEGYAPGLWRNHFSIENVRHFKEKLTGVVSWLGYQRDETWG